jgi:hypothetical protein
MNHINEMIRSLRYVYFALGRGLDGVFCSGSMCQLNDPVSILGPRRVEYLGKVPWYALGYTLLWGRMS